MLCLISEQSKLLDSFIISFHNNMTLSIFANSLKVFVGKYVFWGWSGSTGCRVLALHIISGAHVLPSKFPVYKVHSIRVGIPGLITAHSGGQ